jgi:hypothetical protein
LCAEKSAKGKTLHSPRQTHDGNAAEKESPLAKEVNRVEHVRFQISCQVDINLGSSSILGKKGACQMSGSMIDLKILYSMALKIMHIREPLDISTR